MGVPAPSSPSGSRKSSQQAVSPADAASIPNALLFAIAEDAIAVLEEVLDSEDMDYDECSAWEGWALCGSHWCAQCGCITDKLARARALASAIEARSDATGTGAAEGESAAPEGGDAR